MSVFHWTGGRNIDNNWGTAANWQEGVPTAGNELSFSGTTQLATDNDLAAGTSFTAITFVSIGFSIDGNSLALASNITFDTSVANATAVINSPIVLNNAAQINVVDADATLTISGNLSGVTNLPRPAPARWLLLASIPAPAARCLMPELSR